jgi:hypothetical protein
LFTFADIVTRKLCYFVQYFSDIFTGENEPGDDFEELKSRYSHLGTIRVDSKRRETLPSRGRQNGIPVPVPLNDNLSEKVVKGDTISTAAT